MKVLHVVPAVAPRYGGPSEVALNSVAALREAGVDALLAATDADGSGRLGVPTGAECDYERARCIFFPRFPGESLKLSPALSRWVRAHAPGFDLVHVHSVFSYPSVAAARAARGAGVPYFVRPLGQLDAWSLSQRPLRKRLFLGLVGRRLIQDAAAVHWTDESERSRAPRFASLKPSFVVPLGVDERLFEGDGGTERESVVLFLSRLHPKKNVEILIDAFDALAEHCRGWRLVVAGDGEADYVESLKARAASTRCRVEFVGWLSGDEKIHALRSASLFVLPSKQENFGIVVAEAMAAGTPVVVSDEVALAADVRRAESGWVTPVERGGLAAVLAEAIASPSERRRRGEAGSKLASERYRWASVARDLITEYQRVPSRRRSET